MAPCQLVKVLLLSHQEEKELEKKAAIKEKEQATSEKVENQSEPVSVKALEGSQGQHNPGVRTERLQTGAKGEDKDLFPDSSS